MEDYVEVETTTTTVKDTTSSPSPAAAAGVDPPKAPSKEEESAEFRMEDGRIVRKKGLSWVITGLFLVGDMAGGGIVSLPIAWVRSTLVGSILAMLIVTSSFTFTAHLLGKCWVILQQVYPEYRTHCRKPYPEIGFRSFGNKFKNLISVSIGLTQFGVAVIFLLLCSENISKFIGITFHYRFDMCIIVVILAAVLLPVTFLKSPADFWWAIILASCATLLAVVLIVTGAAKDYQLCGKNAGFPPLQPGQLFLGLGAFLFAYGGHATFPTIQHDMKRPDQFTKSVLLCYAIMSGMYIPVSLLGYLTYGDALEDSIIPSLQTGWIQQAVSLLISLHCMFSLSIILNPLNQEAEEWFKIPHHFTFKRLFVRTGMMAAIVCVAETVPSFGPLLDLIGGSTLALTSLIFPCICYIQLMHVQRVHKALPPTSGPTSADHPPSSKETSKTSSLDRIRFIDAVKNTPKLMIVLCVLTMVVGSIGGGAATYAAIKALTFAKFVPPCYVAPFLRNRNADAAASAVHTGHYQCCGTNHTLHQLIDANHTFTDVCLQHRGFV